MPRIASFLLLGLGLLPLAASAQNSDAAPATPCATLDDCVGEVLASARTRRQINQDARTRITAYGEEAVDRLVPLLMHPDPYVRESAGLALHAFQRIDPRHLPALVEAWRHGDTINDQGRGNGWMPLPIAATGTEEALSLLWADMLRDPQQSSNSQVFFALARFGERLRPRVHAQLQGCAAQWTRTCDGVISLFDELDGRFPRPVPPVMPQWALEELVALVGPPSAAREAAVGTLARLRHPAALPGLQRELADLPAETASQSHPDSDGEWETRRLIGDIAAYGETARTSGPAIARYLDARYNPDLRADAALALGQVGDRSAIAALIAMAPHLGDDWLLAYNVTESLGRLRAGEARPLIEGLQRRHWHRGVRNNAARALAAIAGGPFEGAPYPTPRNDDGDELLYTGDLRFDGDEASTCSSDFEERHVDASRDPIGSIRWPRRGGAELNPTSLGEARARDLRRRIPVQQVQGEPQGVLPVRDGVLIAFNGGEFGGGLFYVPNEGETRALLNEPVVAAWRMTGRLYVAAGLNHLGLDQGRLYVVDPERLVVERAIRLPASPYRLFATAQRAVIIHTLEGDIAVREDGRLVDSEAIGACAE